MLNLSFVNTRQIYNHLWDTITHFALHSVFSIYKVVFKVQNYFKRIMNDDIKFVDVKEYTHFKIYEYIFIHNNKTYQFNYIIDNDNDSDINTLLIDTLNNIENKDKNKQRILHVSLQNENTEFLCDITKELQKFKYYFDLDPGISTDEVLDNNSSAKQTCTKQILTLLYWKDIVHIIENKYNRILDPHDIYLYFILNDTVLTEKTLVLSSILNDPVLF